MDDKGTLIPMIYVPEHMMGSFVNVKRALIQRENDRRQIELYSPCGCGSGKKLKFCCYRKAKEAKP